MKPVAKGALKACASQATAAKKPTAKSPTSIRGILDEAWKNHLRGEGIDLHNRQKRNVSLVKSQLPQPCGHRLVLDKEIELIQKHKQGKAAPTRPVEKPQQACGQPYIAKRLEEERKKALEAFQEKKTAENQAKK